VRKALPGGPQEASIWLHPSGSKSASTERGSGVPRRGSSRLPAGGWRCPSNPHFTGGEYAGQRFSRDNPCVSQQRQCNGKIQCREFFELIGGSDVQRECSRDAGKVAAFECGINARQRTTAGGPWNAADMKSGTPCLVQLHMRHQGIGHGCSVPEGRNQHGRWFTERVQSGQSTRG
jgi:hypothetical protein